jgi:hypothetical protein
MLRELSDLRLDKVYPQATTIITSYHFYKVEIDQAHPNVEVTSNNSKYLHRTITNKFLLEIVILVLRDRVKEAE